MRITRYQSRTNRGELKMTQYINGMIWLDPRYTIPKDPKKALLYIKELRKPAINKIIEAMENSPFYFKAIDLELPD